MFNFPFLPIEGLHEYNLDWILKQIKDFGDILDNKIDDLILNEIEKVLINFTLKYNESTKTIYLTGGANIG